MSENNHITNKSNAKIIFAIVINVFISLFEIVSGILSGSLALISDAIHNFSDVGVLGLSLYGEKVKNKDSNATKTYGYKRAEIVIAFINAMVLIATVLFILFEAVQRLADPQVITGDAMIITAVIALIGNGIATYFLEKDSHDNLNLKSAWLHSMQDAIFSLGVVAGAILIKFFGWYLIDPLISIVLSIFILKEAILLFRQALNVLMESVPSDIDFEKVKKALESFQFVNSANDIHIWQTDSENRFLSAHLNIDEVDGSKRDKLLAGIQTQIKEKFGIKHSTIQMVTNNDIKREGLDCEHCN